MPRAPRSIGQYLRARKLRDDEYEKGPYDLIFLATNDRDWALADLYPPIPGIKDVVCGGVHMCRLTILC